MATPTQVYNALKVHNLFNIQNANAPINFSQWDDITDWSSLGLSTSNGDVVKIIGQVVAPSGIVAYENAGFAGSSFASPDTSLTDLVSPQWNLPAYTGTTTYVNGNYVFNLKVQVTPNGLSAFIVEKTFSFNLPKGVTPTLTLTETWDCTVATYTSTDTSEYCTSGCASGYSVTTIVREHTVFPPDVSGQATVTADAQTIYLGAPDNQLWTGTYEAKLSNTITLTQGDSEIITHASVTTEAKVICDDLLCGLYCSLKTLYNTFKGYLGINTTEATRYQAMLTKGFFAYDMALRARLCSDEATVATYVADFYKFTGADPNCDCCKDESSPVIPTNVINGTNGTNGETPTFRVTAGTIFQYKFPSDGGWTTIFDFASITGLNGTSFLQGAGVPSSGDGADGDSFLDVVTYDIYLKTAGIWSITGNIQGASGTNGTDGVAVLVNDQSTSTTPSTTANYVLKTYTLPANTLGTNSDMLKLEVTISRDTTVTSSTGISVYKINFGGTQIELGLLYGYGSNSNQNTITINIVKKSATEIQCDAVVGIYTEDGQILGQSFGVGSVVAGFDFTVTNTITLTTTSQVAGDTYSKLFRITKFKK